MAAEQARLTYRMGLHLLKDLTEALALTIDPDGPTRLTEADLPAVIAALEASAIPWRIGLRQRCNSSGSSAAMSSISCPWPNGS